MYKCHPFFHLLFLFFLCSQFERRFFVPESKGSKAGLYPLSVDNECVIDNKQKNSFLKFPFISVRFFLSLCLLPLLMIAVSPKYSRTQGSIPVFLYFLRYTLIVMWNSYLLPGLDVFTKKQEGGLGFLTGKRHFAGST